MRSFSGVLVSCAFLASSLSFAQSLAMPHLEKRGDTTQLIVDGKPCFMLAGELHNSSSSSLKYMKPIWPQMAAMQLNTVLTPVSWELIEPTEGHYARCDLAVVNLSGYNPGHPGLEYEIRHLFAGGPPSRFVYVYERTTDADGVISGVLELWSRLESEPAKVSQLLFLRISDSQDVGYQLQFQKPIKGTGWMVKTFLGSEREYVPIAPRIVAYMNSLQSNEARS